MSYIEENIKDIDDDYDGNTMEKSADEITENYLVLCENILALRNKFKFENESKYAKANEIHKAKKLNDLNINYELNSNIKKQSTLKLILKIIWYLLLCTWYYLDIIIDAYTCYRFYKQSNMIYFWLTLSFILRPNFLFSLQGLFNEFSVEWIFKFILFNVLGY